MSYSVNSVFIVNLCALIYQLIKIKFNYFFLLFTLSDTFLFKRHNYEIIIIAYIYFILDSSFSIINRYETSLGKNIVHLIVSIPVL